MLFALLLLQMTVQGSGFNQKDGTLHLRVTFLPPEDQFDAFLSSLSVRSDAIEPPTPLLTVATQTFHGNFMAQWKTKA